MSLLDLARDGVRTDTDFSAGIPATGRMAAESANFAFHRWDTGRVMATVRAALNQARSVTPTALGGGGTASYDAFLTLQTNRFDCSFYQSQADSDDLMRISLPDGAVTTFIADSGTAFSEEYLGEVGDGRLFNGLQGAPDAKVIVWDPVSAAHTTYTNVALFFIDPRFGGKNYCYVRANGDVVATDTIGAAETVLGYSVGETEEGDALAPTTSIYFPELGLFQHVVSDTNPEHNSVVWSGRGVREVTPVRGVLPNATRSFKLMDRMISDTGVLFEDHRLGSQVQVFEGTIIGAWNRVAIGLMGNSLYFSASLLPGTWEEVKVYGTIEVATMVGGRVWYKLTGSNTWYFTGVLP